MKLSNKEIAEALTLALPYVYAAYECAFPNEQENRYVAWECERVISELEGEFPEGEPRYYKGPIEGAVVEFKLYEGMPLVQGKVINILANGRLRVEAGNGYVELDPMNVKPVFQ